MDISDEDFIKYGIFPELHGPRYTQQEDDYDAPVRPKVIDETFGVQQQQEKRRQSDFSFKKPSHTAVPSSSSVIVKRLRRDEPDPDQLFEGLKDAPGGGQPIETRPDTRIVIPYKTRMAADILLMACENNEIRLDYNAKSDLQKLVDCDDEYTMVDPPIVIWDSLYTGTCNIYMKEVVRLSTYLVACYLKCTYQVEAVPEASSNPKLYTEAKVKPYHDSNVEHAQPFGCEAAVMNAMTERFHNPQEVEDRLKYVKIHLMRVGHLSSFQATDPEFLAEQIDMMGTVLNNEKRVVQERPIMGRAGDN